MTKTLAICCMKGIILPSCIGIIINHYKDPYLPSNIVESKRVIFMAQVGSEKSIPDQYWNFVKLKLKCFDHFGGVAKELVVGCLLSFQINKHGWCKTALMVLRGAAHVLWRFVETN